MNLELYSTDDLINELFNRTTFCGVILKSRKEHLKEMQLHDDFEVFTTLEEDTTVELLGTIIEAMDHKKNQN